MTIRCRRATTADLDALVALFDAYRVFYQQPSDPDRARAYLHERLERDESVVLLATNGDNANGAAVGFTQLYPLFSSVRMRRLWLLNDLFVAEGVRRSGVAHALLDAATNFARSDGAVGLILETGRDNHPARALYRATGWHEEGNQWYSLDM